MAQENGSWGYDRIAGALANLGHRVSDQTVGNVLRRHGIPTAPKRSQSTTSKDFFSAHMAVVAGSDFFTVEVLTWRGVATYYVLFFIYLETRRITLAGVTRRPTEAWITQMARNAVDDKFGALRQCRYVLHDRDAKFCSAFDDVLASEGIQSRRIPPRSPNLNAYAERWVRSGTSQRSAARPRDTFLPAIEFKSGEPHGFAQRVGQDSALTFDQFDWRSGLDTASSGSVQKSVDGPVEGLLVNFLNFFALLDAGPMVVTPAKTARFIPIRHLGAGDMVQVIQFEANGRDASEDEVPVVRTSAVIVGFRQRGFSAVARQASRSESGHQPYSFDKQDVTVVPALSLLRTPRR